MTRTEAYLALNLLPRIGPIRVRRLLERFGNPERILSASGSELKSVPGIGSEMADSIRDWENLVDVAEEQRRMAEHGIGLLTIEDDAYPPALREIHDPPHLLYIKGEILERDRYAIAVVGSRRVTHYGREAAQRLSFQLAHAGVTILSGLARGIDTAAHEAALAAGGRTIAVLGSGIGHLYPPENAALAEKIAENGAVISEFPVLYVPDRQSFPLRNRIVSGMSRGILVVEAPARSGALITANQAMEQGRNVYAVPGPIDRPTSEGCNRLIQDGAKLVIDSRDVLDEMEMLLPPSPRQGELELPDAAAVSGPPLDDTERAVLAALGDDELPIDTIIEEASLPSSVVSVTLLKLEMKRRVKQLPGKYFVKLG
ncbi:MAG: DNA-processing protein DprA [Verrucomicrobiae bacterium]|nr:DNA-processing protein DprA [Verrucomicrobiae bacterium]